MFMRQIHRRMISHSSLISSSETSLDREIFRKVRLGVALIASLAVLTPGFVCAEEAEKTEKTAKIEEPEPLGMQKFPNRIMLRAGWYHLFGSSITITTQNTIAGIGTTIDFNETLGGETSSSSARVDARYRFNPRHSLGFTYYQVDQDGNKTINQDITFEDTIIKAGAQTSSNLSIDLYRFFYNWSFYSNDKVELALSPGLYMADFKFSLTGSATVQVGEETQMVTPSTVSETFTAPLPSIGGFVNYYITPRLNTELRADVFWIQAGSFTGSMVEFYAGLEYRIWDNIAVGAAYDRLQVGVDIDDIDTNIGWNLVYLYGSLYFFSI